MKKYGLTIKRQMHGLYDGDMIRAELVEGSWRFQMLCNRICEKLPYYEFSPHGVWTPIGSWRTLDAGMWAGSKLKCGTHFYDSSTAICRVYNDEIYRELRYATSDGTENEDDGILSNAA